MKKSNQSSKTNKQITTSDNQQKTLFQCWKPSSSTSASNSTSNSTSSASTSTSTWTSGSSSSMSSSKLATNNRQQQNSEYFAKPAVPKIKKPVEDISEVLINEDDEDLQLIQASDSFLNNYSINQSTINETLCNSKANSSNLDDDNQEDRVTVGIDENIIQSTQFTDTTGFDYNSGSVWIYPVSDHQQIRSYQYNIVEQCLFKNTMVVLPTGMGKTFIAAVVMYNYYRWYPLGKVIFMAPTKPLVNQQSDACYNIVGIPKNDMTTMTGQMAPEKRKELWDTKRVFFLTPQVISNDILRGTVDVSLIKCVILDEAHKALGEYAFCKVIESINETNKNFRIIALTATPGSDNKAVQNVISKLLISHIELRSDESIDIQQYSNNRQVNKFVLGLNDEIVRIRNAFYDVIRSPLKRLEMNRVLSVKDPGMLNKFAILTRREDFRKNVATSMDSKRVGMIESDMALLVTLVHALELLIQYGVKSFYMFLKSFVENTDGQKSAAQQNKLRTEIGNSSQMADYYEKFKEFFDNKSKPVPRTLRHPKLLKLEEVILEHFKKFGKNDTRVMIFSQYRESVYEITEMLSEHEDIKPMEFVGQSSGGNRKTVTQKEQLAVVQKFREGGYNTLVSTCVGEEGLDIGEVDLIINYDSQKSPIRLIQRMGRTGRKREGRIVILLTEGKEEQSYLTSLNKKKNIYKVILNGKKNFNFYQNNPLMIPKGLKPKCHKMKIVLPQEDQLVEKPKKTSKKKEKIEDEEPKKKPKTTKGSKKKSKNDDEQKEDSFLSQRFPDLDLDITSNKPNSSISVNKTPKTNTTQFKLFNDSNILSLKSTKLDSDILNKQKIVPDPPNFKKIFKCLTRKGKENEDLFSASFDLSESIKLWQTDEDDFMVCKETSLNITNNLDESSLIEKFDNFYINLIDGLSEDEYNDDYEKNSDLAASVSMKAVSEPSNQVQSMIIDDTLSLSHHEPEIMTKIETFNYDVESKPVKETTLNDLFMDDDEDDDDDLKYLNDVNLDVKSKKFCIDETIHEEPNFKVVNKALSSIKSENIKEEKSSSPLSVQNSSTPRSILKKRAQITYSPLSYSPMVDNNKNKNLESSVKCEDKNVSMIGMTQALDLLNSTGKLIVNQDKCVDLFDMKSTLSFLFGNDLTPKNDSIQVLDCTGYESTSKKTRRLRFDEASIVETSGHKKSFRSEDDDSIIYRKKLIKYNKFKSTRVNKDLSLSFSDGELSKNKNVINSDDSEYGEIIGNNNLMSQSQTQIIDDDEFEEQFVQLNKKKTKRAKNKFVMDEAELSGDDTDDDEEDDEYDLKDSFVDTNEVSCDESMYLRYQKSLRDAENNRPNFLTRKLKPITDDIFSQMPTQDTSYDYDSFCVPDDHVSIYEKKSKKSKKSKKREKENNQEKQDRFRRIKNFNMTSLDEEMECDNQSSFNHEEKFQMTQMPKKKKLINDDRDTDDDITSEEILIIESKANKKKSNYSQSLIIIDEEEEDDFKNLKKKNNNEPVILDDDDDFSILKSRAKNESNINQTASSSKFIEIKKKFEPTSKSELKYESLVTDDDDDDFKLLKSKNSPVLKNESTINPSMRFESNTKVESCLKLHQRNEPSIKEDNQKYFKSPSLKMDPKKELIQINNDEEEEDDEEFNNWINNTMLNSVQQNSDKSAPKIEDSSNYFNKKCENKENKSFMSHFNQTNQNIFEGLKKEKSKFNNNNTTVSESNTTILDVPKNTNWIIVDASLLTSAADILKNVRRIWSQDKVLIHPALGCDFIISQRYAALRFKWTEMSSASMRDQLIERFAKCRSLYNNVIAMVIDDRENNKTRTKLFDSVIANLVKCSSILFSKSKTEEFSHQLYYLSNNEKNLGFEIDLDCAKILDKKKKEISFYLSIPNLSLINCLYLSKNYDNITKFCNSSLEDLKSKGKMNDRKARKLLKFLIDS